jgi:hypothetical protein
VDEYLVDFLSCRDDEWYSGDDRKSRRYPKEMRNDPFNVTITRHCNTRTLEGWHLHSVIPVAGGFEGLTVGAWVILRRESR